MRIVQISEKECKELLGRISLGRLACSFNDQPYIVPVYFAYEPECLLIFSTVGKKIHWMRQNPKVCVQIDEIGSRSNWTSVVVDGTYVELLEPQYSTEKERARERLGQSADWWLAPLAERREQIEDLSVQPVFFRVNIQSMSGLRGIPEAL
jgi:uncharacterized protein